MVEKPETQHNVELAVLLLAQVEHVVLDEIYCS